MTITQTDFKTLFNGNSETPNIIMNTGQNFASSSHTILKSKNVTNKAIIPIAMRIMPPMRPSSFLFLLLSSIIFYVLIQTTTPNS